VEAVPAVTLAGTKLSVESAIAGGGLTSSWALLLAPPFVPVIVTFVDVVTPFVVTVKVALVAPPGTTTLAATAATVGSLLVSATAVPAAGAAEFSVTVPVEVPPPVTLVAFRLREEIVASGGDVTKRTS
jgi:hypothetical protein